LVRLSAAMALLSMVRGGIATGSRGAGASLVAAGKRSAFGRATGGGAAAFVSGTSAVMGRRRHHGVPSTSALVPSPVAKAEMCAKRAEFPCISSAPALPLPFGVAASFRARGVELGSKRGMAARSRPTMMSASSQKAYDGEQLRLLDSDECILVDELDQVVGSASKKFCHLMENIDADKALHRAFSVFLFTGKGELVLQKRSSDKILFPDRWTNTCCSHPLSVADELDNPPCPEASGVKRAAVRKLEHELGIPMGQVPEADMHFMTRIVYKAAVGEDNKWGEHEVDYILVGQRDADLDKLNPNEVSEIRLLKRNELDDLIKAEDRGEVMLSPWFRLIAQKWLPMWWDALLEGELLSTRDTGAIHKF